MFQATSMHADLWANYSEKTAHVIASQVADALSHVHSLDLMHGDIVVCIVLQTFPLVAVRLLFPGAHVFHSRRTS